MAVCTGYDTYQSNHYDGMDPKRLILMLYDGALKHIRLAKEGIDENDIRKRGENLGRVISIVSELNACLDTSIQDDSVHFLGGLYSAILAELPKVSITNDVEILNRSHSYIFKLKEIWETNVMGINATVESEPKKPEDTPKETGTDASPLINRQVKGYGTYGGKGTSISV